VPAILLALSFASMVQQSRLKSLCDLRPSSPSTENVGRGHFRGKSENRFPSIASENARLAHL